MEGDDKIGPDEIKVLGKANSGEFISLSMNFEVPSEPNSYTATYALLDQMGGQASETIQISLSVEDNASDSIMLKEMMESFSGESQKGSGAFTLHDKSKFAPREERTSMMINRQGYQHAYMPQQ